MKINTPILEMTDSKISIILEAREEKCLYGFFSDKGYQHTVLFTEKELEDFLPSFTSDKFISDIHENYKRRIATYEEALRTKKHPTRTFINEEGEEEKANIDSECENIFKKTVEILKSIQGEINLIKYI